MAELGAQNTSSAEPSIRDLASLTDREYVRALAVPLTGSLDEAKAEIARLRAHNTVLMDGLVKNQAERADDFHKMQKIQWMLREVGRLAKSFDLALGHDDHKSCTCASAGP